MFGQWRRRSSGHLSADSGSTAAHLELKSTTAPLAGSVFRGEGASGLLTGRARVDTPNLMPGVPWQRQGMTHALDRRHGTARCARGLLALQCSVLFFFLRGDEKNLVTTRSKPYIYGVSDAAPPMRKKKKMPSNNPTLSHGTFASDVGPIQLGHALTCVTTCDCLPQSVPLMSNVAVTVPFLGYMVRVYFPRGKNGIEFFRWEVKPAGPYRRREPLAALNLPERQGFAGGGMCGTITRASVLNWPEDILACHVERQLEGWGSPLGWAPAQTAVGDLLLGCLRAARETFKVQQDAALFEKEVENSL